MARRFGGYRLDGLIGRGSVGEVWRAHDDATDRTLALKILSIGAAEDPDYRRRFEREARVGAGLDNPHIVPIHDFGEQDGRLFLAMAHIPGLDVAARLRGGPMGVPEAVDLISQIAEALDAAHAAGLVHRDVKPANIIVHPSGFAYLIDFGIARASNQTTITATGFTVGTLAYMAPERFAGHGDARSDIYSLACVLYECLTTRRPFGDTDPVRQLHAHLREDPPRASATNSAVPKALDQIIARGMAKEPDSRYRSAGELAAAALSAIGMPQPLSHTPPVLAPASTAPTVPARVMVRRPRSEPYAAAASPTRHPHHALSDTPLGTPPTRRIISPAARQPAARVAGPKNAAAQRIGPGTVAKSAVLAVVVFGAIALATALLTHDSGKSAPGVSSPSITVAPRTTPAPPLNESPTTAEPPHLSIPVPPGFGTAPFQIPGISNRSDDSGTGDSDGRDNGGHGNANGHGQHGKKDK
ncbi:serine/threonine-protein kinase [Nocardia pseudobrasiliensis]|uniref:serine/threonine-protein kinase n=1 Tax=Nocardia pseudobrasiliensis TaxID=45979 RepID=UPI001471A303|nr:serine/threonine-protein kinase [Nocardia pseudobrasiliensis]